MFLCFVFLMLSRLFIAALWSPAGKELTSWLLLVMFIVFMLLSYVISWARCGRYLIVSFPDLCRLSYLLRCKYRVLTIQFDFRKKISVYCVYATCLHSSF